MEPESRLTSKLAGFRNRLMNPTAKPQSGSKEPDRANPAFGPGLSPEGPSPSPLDSAYDFGALGEQRDDGPDAMKTNSGDHSASELHSYINTLFLHDIKMHRGCCLTARLLIKSVNSPGLWCCREARHVCGDRRHVKFQRAAAAWASARYAEISVT